MSNLCSVCHKRPATQSRKTCQHCRDIKNAYNARIRVERVPAKYCGCGMPIWSLKAKVCKKCHGLKQSRGRRWRRSNFPIYAPTTDDVRDFLEQYSSGEGLDE